MTTVEKTLAQTISRKLGNPTVERVIETLADMGLLDFTRCRAAVASAHVAQLVEQGMGKVDAMYAAADKFCLSYECVRNYVYNYKKQM